MWSCKKTFSSLFFLFFVFCCFFLMQETGSNRRHCFSAPSYLFCCCTSSSGKSQRVATGWCTRKWLRFDQTIRNFISGRCRLVHKEMVVVQSNYKKFYFWWFGNPTCGDSTGSNRHFLSVWLPYQYFCQIFFRVYGACLANHFMTNFFAHTKPHQNFWVNIDQLVGQHVGTVCLRL